MIKICTVLLTFFFFVNSSFAQLTGTSVKIIDDYGKLIPVVGSHKRSAVAPTKCTIDTVQYPYYKTSSFNFITVNKGRGLGQYYEVPKTLTLYGFSFHAIVATNPPTNKKLRLICNVYRAGIDSLPKGSPMRSDTITIDTNFYKGMITKMERHATFKTPITLDSAYIITLESDSVSLNTYVLVNNYSAGDGRKEYLNSGSINGVWYSGRNLNVGGIPFNSDVILYPYVQYKLGADFTIKSQCYNLADTVKFTNQLSKSMAGSKMYNRYLFYNLGYFCHWWDAGNNTGTIYSVDNKVKYSQKENYKIQLISTIYGYRGMQNGCSDTAEKWLYYKPDFPQISGSSNVCIGDTAKLTVSNADTGTVYEWFKKPTDSSPFFKGVVYRKFPLVRTDTVYIRGNNHGCFTNFRMQILNVNAYPSTLKVTNDSICSGSKANLKGFANVGNVEWYASAISPGLLYSGNVFQTPVLTKDTFFYVQANNKGCIKSPRVKVSALVGGNFAPSPPVLSNDTAICKAATSGLALNAAAQSGLTIRWFDAGSGSAAIATGSPYVFTPTIREVKTLYADAYNGVCGSTRVPVVVTVEDFPAITKSFGDTICRGDSLILLVELPFGEANWYDASTSGTLLYTGTRYAFKPIVPANYYVETSSGICKSPTRKSIVGQVNSFPVVLKLWGDTICAKNKATLKSKFTGPGTIHWFEYDTSSIELGKGKTFQTGVLIGPKSFYGQPENAGCFGPIIIATPFVKALPFPGFSYQVFTNNQSVKVSPVNPGTATVLWDFGDGKKSTANTVTHFYSTPGTYIIKLTLTGANGCKDTMVNTVSIGVGGLSSISTLSAMKVYPNPAQGELTIELKEISGKVNVAIYTLNGSLVKSVTKMMDDNQIKLDVGMLTTGLYIVKIEGYQALLFMRE